MELIKKNIIYEDIDKNINNIINKYKDTKYKYFIFVSSNIYFILKNVKEWNNLEDYIKNTNYNIYFMMYNKKDINKNFFIIKNNNNFHNFNNFGKIPNQYIINNNIIYNNNKSILYYTLNIDNYILSKFDKKIKFTSAKLKYKSVKYEIVVARYNEDLSWLEKIPKNIKITIYNKGDVIINNINKAQIIPLPNIGRESHTYIYHIVKNYNNLADTTIFCQGDSIAHSPDFINLLKNIKYFEPVQPLSLYYCTDKFPPLYVEVPPKQLFDKTTNLHINNNKVHVEYIDNDFITQYPYNFYYDYNMEQTIIQSKELYNTNNLLEFLIERFNIKNIDTQKLIPMCYSAIFAISKEAICDNSDDFYNNILNNILYEITLNKNSGKLEHRHFLGYLLEKIWLIIYYIY
jgi:hypothetical protein